MTQVIAQSLANLQVQINASNHPIIADEPISIGGDNQGPSPYDLLLSSLAACKVMTLHMYARRKGWDLQKARVTLNHQKMYAKDCDICESEPNAKIDLIECDLHFEGDLTAEQIERLAEIADRCPVHRTLSSETKVRTSVIE